MARATLATVLLLAASAAAADDSVKDASTRNQETLTAAAGRLESAVDRAEDAHLATEEQRAQRADLLGRARDLEAEAASTRRQGDSRQALADRIDAVAIALVALADQSVEAARPAGDPAAKPEAPFGETGGAGSSLAHPHAATTVLRFRDVSEDVLSVSGRLTETEAADARQLIQAGNDLVAQVKDTRRGDHRARTEHLRSLEDITRQLQAVHQTGLLDRKKGQPFLASWQTPDGWVPVQAQATGLAALRVRFEKPGSAWVVLENSGADAREWFTEIEFYDQFGESTGMASLKMPARKELKAGEVRRVLVPIIPTTDRFWEETTGFTIYVE